jgi:ATP-binding cassette, subfamily C (CFTR/MRP), member 1
MRVVCLYTNSLPLHSLTNAANALGIFSPVVTFVIFVLMAHRNGLELDTETAFTTTALLGLVTHPANMIMTIIPQAVGSLVASIRIQRYLLQPRRSDQRLCLTTVAGGSKSIAPAIRFDNVTIKHGSSTVNALSNINFTVDKGSIIVCSGPTGSGKTILAKAILGEMPISAGSLAVSSTRIGYCEQTPWLPIGTLKNAICGFSMPDETWYREVVRLCCLEYDLMQLTDGDQTLIGSRGLNLSGGQRQRVVCQSQ